MGAAQCACRRSKRSRGRHSAVSPALSGQMTTLRLEARGRQQGEVLFEGYNSILRGELSLHPSRGPLPRTPRHRLATSPAYHSDCQTVPPHRPPLPSDPDSSPTTPPFTIAPSALLAGKAPCTSTFTPAAGECRDPPAHCGPMLSAEEGPCIGTFTPAGVSMAHLATIKSSRVLTPGRAGTRTCDRPTPGRRGSASSPSRCALLAHLVRIRVRIRTRPRAGVRAGVRV